MTAAEMGEVVAAWGAENPRIAVEFDPPPSARAITLTCTRPDGRTVTDVTGCRAELLNYLTEIKVRKFLDQAAREMVDAQPA